MSNTLTEFFYALTPERVLDAVEVEGRRCTGRFIVLNSYENRVYQLELDDGSFVVAKFYRPGRWSDDAILDEHDFLEDLEVSEVGVAGPLAVDGEETLSDVEGIRFSVCPRIGGRSPEDMTPEQLVDFGRAIARVHAVGSIDDAPHRIRMAPDTFGGEGLEVLREYDLVPPSVRDLYLDSARRLIDRITPLFEGVPVQRIHGDCHLGNLLRTPAGLVFLDFDDMVVGPVVQDLWLMIGGRDSWAQARQEQILAGYESMADFDRSTLTLIEPLRAMRLIHFAAWLARRWEDPAFQIGFPGFGTEAWWAKALGDLREQAAVVEESLSPWSV